MNPQSPHSQPRRGPRALPPQREAPSPSQTNPAAFNERSRRTNTRAQRPAQERRDGPQVTWVRTGDLPSLLAGRVLARGVDLHAALVRRAMRRPTTAVKNAAGAVKRALAPGGRRQARTEPQHGTEGTGI